MLSLLSLTLTTLLLYSPVIAHVAPWHPAMYCFNGNQGKSDDPNSSAAHNPMFNLPFKEWWFHAVNGCDKFPPPEGTFLELPAGGSFEIELALNRAFTSMSYDGRLATEWPGGDRGAPASDGASPEKCITNPNIHTQNETMAAGTAFAISYNSDIKDVTPENLVVFTVRYHTPWKRQVFYDVPAALPECPPGGCTCAWGWVPNGCGEPNMYMIGFKCRVVGATSELPLGVARPPVWCEDDRSKCVVGAKQMIYWHQAERNNIEVEGKDLSGNRRSPAYNQKLGYKDGAQNDIAAVSASASVSSSLGFIGMKRTHARSFTRRSGGIRF